MRIRNLTTASLLPNLLAAQLMEKARDAAQYRLATAPNR